MEYLHYTAVPIERLVDGIKQPDHSIKSNGLWLSEGDDWLKWCESEGFYTCDLDNCYIYGASINKSSLIVISSLSDLDALHLKYQNKSSGYIDWKKVAEDYDGICFENYFSVKQESFMKSDFSKTWFLAIDVNSACIWNPTKVIECWSMIRKGVDNVSKIYKMKTDYIIRDALVSEITAGVV